MQTQTDNLKKLLICLLFGFFVFICLNESIAQNFAEQMLYRSVQPPFNPTDSVAIARNIHEIGAAHLDSMQYRVAEVILLQAYGIASRYNEKKLMARISNNIAECYSVTGRHSKAEELYLKTFDLLGSLGDTNAMAIILINLGDEYAKTGRYELAAETELKAIRLKEAANDYRKLAFYYQKLGELFIDRDIVRWETYAMKALALTRNDENTTLRATVAVYNDLGAIWRIKNDFVKAGAYYDTMYRISQQADYRKGIATATSERALLLFDQKRYSEALPLAREAYNMVVDTDDDYPIVYDATLMARILLKLGRHTEALPLLEMALNRARKAGLKPEVPAALEYLSEAYVASGKYREAYECQQERYSLKDSIDGARVQQALYQMQTRFETEKKQQLIDRLTERNLEHARWNSLLVGLLSVSGLVLLLGIFVFVLRNRALRQTRALHKKEQELLETERKRLALELELKIRELTTAAVQLINKNAVLNDLRSELTSSHTEDINVHEVIRQIDQNLNLDADWQNFSRHFEEVHPDFFVRLRQQFPTLTPNEERLSAYLRINLNTKEISQMLNVTIAAIDKSRNRLRKKLGIGSDVNLNDFFAKF
jgi:tetratricopeptide (TPR) repeat protein/DNA-binding CsgD family transcriptional regulator